MSPEMSGQTNNDFQQVTEEIEAVPVYLDSKNQQSKDPDLPLPCPALRDSWGTISHQHLYRSHGYIANMLNTILSSPMR